MDTSTTAEEKPARPRSQCPRCQIMVADGHMKRHTQSNNCLERYYKNLLAAKTKGMVKVSDHYRYGDLSELANVGAIPGAVIYGYQYEAYVPEWVASAYKMYRGNSGYAELSFLEFLEKVNSEK